MAGGSEIGIGSFSGVLCRWADMARARIDKPRRLLAMLGLLVPGLALADDGDGRRLPTDVVALMQACHDRAWHQPIFRDVPNAGVSVYRNMISDDTVVAYWIVDWQQTQAAGRCTGDRRTGRLVEFMRFGE